MISSIVCFLCFQFVDDDNKCYLEINYTFDIGKEWLQTEVWIIIQHVSFPGPQKSIHFQVEICFSC